MRLADLGAGDGYTTFLLARAVGADGVVYAQNNKFATERFLEPAWTERLKTPELRNVVRVDREFDDPPPPEATELDGVINVLFYHDTYWMGTDRARMNRAIFAALRPGGFYVIVDHSARAGAGASEAELPHRGRGVDRGRRGAAGGFERASAGSSPQPGRPARSGNALPSAATAAEAGTADRSAS